MLLGTLGSGASATVHRAFDPRLRRDVALKVLHAHLPEGSRANARFLAEARAMARLDHPRIVAIHEVGEAGGRSYIASTLVEGRSLAALLDDGPLDPRAAARVAADIAAALAFAHGRGVVHRDVKPGNVLIDARGSAYLADFGLAHRVDLDERLTLDGAILGTPAYVAPEQAGGVGDPLPASDQYGLGAVLYEMLCGRPPFAGPPLMVLVQAIQEEPPRPRSIRPDVPRALEAICLRALAKRPGDRYPSCRDLADDLEAWLADGRKPSARGFRRPGLRVALAALLGAVAAASWMTLPSSAARNVDPPPAPTRPLRTNLGPAEDSPRPISPRPVHPEVATARS